MDLVKEIFRILKEDKFNYSYEFVHDEDKLWGKYDPKIKKWNGLIGDLLDNVSVMISYGNSLTIISAQLYFGPI